ncbi:MAG: hypothetical protein Q7R56_03155 [Nanoarchaeota archaeon]|nr:hypothetical protein [Nanoarchaeota archaeon]
MFEKKELIAFVVGAVLLGLLAGFDDGRPVFVVDFWVVHVVLVILLAFVLLLLYTMAQRLVAQKFGAVVEKSLWVLHRYGFKPKKHSKKGVPLWLVIPVVFFLISRLVFAGVLSSLVVTVPRLRVGHKNPGVNEFERAGILLAGPFAMVVLTIILMGFEPSPLVLAARVLAMSLAISNLLPLPNLDGLSILLGSLPLYMFSVIVLVVMLIMVLYTSVVAALALAVILACTAVSVYWWKTI